MQQSHPQRKKQYEIQGQAISDDEFFGNTLEQETTSIFDPENNRYAYCIVWTTLPLISCLLPFIGHTGICTSNGMIHDFAGPYYVSVDDFAFGRPLKYVKLDHSKYNDKEWDEAVVKSDRHFEKTMHNICFNNCHSHVAQALSNMKYKGSTNWNMIHIWWICIWNSHYVNLGTFVQTYWLSLIFFGIIALLFFV